MEPSKGPERLPADADPNDSRNDREVNLQQPEDRKKFETALREATQTLKAVKKRYVEIRRAQQQKQTLRQRLQYGELPLSEVNAIKQRLEELEFSLESRLLSWRHLQQPFWQAIRFGGLGVIIGWILRGCA